MKCDEGRRKERCRKSTTQIDGAEGERKQAEEWSWMLRRDWSWVVARWLCDVERHICEQSRCESVNKNWNVLIVLSTVIGRF